MLEAGELAPRSKLRLLVEQAPEAVAAMCHATAGADAAAVVAATLGRLAVTADQDALGWICGLVPTDRALITTEAHKLALFAGSGGHIDLEMAMLVAGDHTALPIAEVFHAAVAGDVSRADSALSAALAGSATAVGVLRSALVQLQTFLVARLWLDEGISQTDIVKRLRPPIHPSRVPAFMRTLTFWSRRDLQRSLLYLSQAEQACKRTGAPTESLLRQTLLSVAWLPTASV